MPFQFSKFKFIFNYWFQFQTEAIWHCLHFKVNWIFNKSDNIQWKLIEIIEQLDEDETGKSYRPSPTFKRTTAIYMYMSRRKARLNSKGKTDQLHYM